MGGYVILGMLAAFGLLCGLWAAFGWLLPGMRGCTLVSMGVPSEECLKRIRWLNGMGLLNCPLIVVSDEDAGNADMEICSGNALISRLEWERKRFDGTGNGDHSGRDQRGGLSEL